jgi:hypothetical protein
MENEIMNYEDVMDTEVEPIEMEPEESGSGVGVAMLIGAGLAFATTAIVKLGKKAWAKYQAKKELRRPEDGEIVEVTEEQIEEVTAK